MIPAFLVPMSIGLGDKRLDGRNMAQDVLESEFSFARSGAFTKKKQNSKQISKTHQQPNPDSI